MAKLVNQMFCETHQCQISITGCMLRQQRNQDNPPAWMYNKIPGDPKCSDCDQGKAVMKKNKHMKTKLMSANDDLYEKNKQAAADRKEVFMATDTTSLDSDPAGIPSDLPDGPVPEEIPSTEKTHPRVEETKTCSEVDCDFTCYIGEADHYFYRSKNTKDGFEGVCKKCKTKKAKARRHAKKANQQGRPGRAKKSKQKKNPKKAAAAPPEAAVAEVVTADAAPGNSALTHKENKVFGSSAAEITYHAPGPDKADDMEPGRVIRQENQPVDLDEMVRQVFARSGREYLYEELKKAAFKDMRPPYLQAVYLVACSLDPFNKGA